MNACLSEAAAETRRFGVEALPPAASSPQAARARVDATATAARRARMARTLSACLGVDRDLPRHLAGRCWRHAELGCQRGGLHAAAHAELAQDVRDVDARGAGADEELGGDLAVGV